MKVGKQHSNRSAVKRTLSFLQPSAAAQFFVAFFLAFSLFPTQAFADETTLESILENATTLEIGENQSGSVGEESINTSDASMVGNSAQNEEMQSSVGQDKDTQAEDANATPNAVTTESGSSIQSSSSATAAQSTVADNTTQSDATLIQAAASGTSQFSNLPLTVNATAIEQVQIGLEPLNLIQNGSYDAEEAAAVSSQYATTVGATATTEQRSRIKARLNTALMNVSYSTYGGQSNWCIVDVSDINLPLSTTATAYAKTLVEEVINENPDIFYAGASYGGGSKTVYSTSGTTVILSSVLVQYYYTPSSISGMKTKYETAMQTVLSWVSKDKSYKNSTDAEKAKAVHDWLVRNAKYNYSAYLKGGPAKYGSWSPWSAYGAIVDKSPVCEGYSLAFMAAMQRLGIQASFVTNAGHGWNRVRLKVGSNYYWYNLDITYDDPLKAGNNYADGGYSTTPSTKYFLKSDSVMKKFDSTHAKWSPVGTAGTNTTFDGTWAGGVYPLSSNTHTVSSLSISPQSLTMGDDSSATLTLSASGTNVITGQAKWTSSNPSVAAVSANGVVTSGKKTGSATITVSLGGKTATCTVKVVPALRGATVALASPSTNLSYQSSVPRKPALTVKVNGTTLKEGTDYTVTYPSDTINPGVKTATITGKGNYSGSTTFSYTVTCPITKTTSSWVKSAPTLTYNGAAQKKVPTLTFNGSNSYKYTLKEGTDFTATYKNNVNAGKATVTLTGRGVYTGSWSLTYTIAALDISKASISYDTTKRYTGKAVTQTPTVKVGSTTLAASNYTLKYSNNVKASSKAYMTIIGRNNLKGSVTKTFSIVQNATWKRLYGGKALDTMQAIVKEGWAQTGGTVIIATSSGYWDALSAAGVAGLSGAPVLLVNTNNLPNQTKAELQRLKPKTVIIAGGTAAVNAKVSNQIKSVTGVTPKRLAGGTATGTAAALNIAFKDQWADTAIIATNKGFYDALSAAPISYAKHYPIFLTEGKDKISNETINALKTCGIKQVIVVGSAAAVSDKVVNTLKANGISLRARLGGANAIGTSKEIAKWGLANGMSANNIGVATMKSYYDALCGAALCGKNNAVLVLTSSGNTSATTLVKSNRYSILTGYVFGSTAAVSAKEYNRFAEASK